MTQSRIVLPDLHVPFHDKKLLDCWLERLEDRPAPHREWAGVDIIGDFLDCYSLSRFDTNPMRRRASLQDELDQGKEILSRIRELVPKAEIRYSEGNHEDRLRKILWGKSRALAELRGLTIPELLGLDDWGILWHSVENPYKIGDLWYTHGDLLRGNAGLSARAKSEAMGGSVIIGHTHRLGYCPRTFHTGVTDAYEVGHMTDPKQLDYHRHVLNWQAGWAEVHFEGSHHWVNFYRVVDRGRERVVVGPDGVIGSWRTRR
ncbi:hypothetical protein LCGC14_0455160 [marine sediment metagenome]|uniref:Calcineurin-like phosphoesterase domain-containing protein n=1 Tax=marine sediment metagenome TaxID=412755 RepID=A0A0F9SZN5_9ZZZZ